MLAHSSVVAHGTLALAVVVAMWWRLRAWTRDQPEPIWRPVAFGIGLALAWLAVSPPMERAAEASFTGHMVQHVILIAAVAPLLVFGLPQRSLGSPPTGDLRALRPVAPLISAVSFVVVLVATHFTGWYDEALHNPWVHDAEHVAYLATAVAVWATIGRARRASTPLRLVAAFAVVVGGSFVAAILLTAPRPLIATYVDELGLADALADQQRAAALMWVSGMAVTLPLVLVSAWRWASAEQRRAERAEALTDRGVVPGGSAHVAESRVVSDTKRN